MQVLYFLIHQIHWEHSQIRMLNFEDFNLFRFLLVETLVLESFNYEDFKFWRLDLLKTKTNSIFQVSPFLVSAFEDLSLRWHIFPTYHAYKSLKLLVPSILKTFEDFIPLAIIPVLDIPLPMTLARKVVVGK